MPLPTDPVTNADLDAAVATIVARLDSLTTQSAANQVELVGWASHTDGHLGTKLDIGFAGLSVEVEHANLNFVNGLRDVVTSLDAVAASAATTADAQTTALVAAVATLSAAINAVSSALAAEGTTDAAAVATVLAAIDTAKAAIIAAIPGHH